MRILTVVAAGALFAGLQAQTPIAPSTEPVGSTRGEDWLGYNIRQSFEVGARMLSTEGNRDKYRSDVNYRNGLRLLSSRLEIHSKDGHGGPFDEVVLTTLGLGNDPYQHSSLRVQKDGLYRYEMIWRQNEYFNPAFTIIGGNHRVDTLRRLQDHAFTLLPGKAFQVFGGYSRNTQSGPALTTTNLFDLHRGGEFPLFQNVRREQNEYRAGFEAAFAGFKFIGARNWEFYKDDTEDSATGRPNLNGSGPSALTGFRRAQPNHGSTPGWRAHLFTDRPKWYAVNARFTHADGRRNFIVDETAIGADRLNAARNQQIIVTGDARRPVLATNATVSVFPADRVTLTNHLAFTQTRIDGQSVYQQFNNNTFDFRFAAADFLGVRLLSNSTDAQVQVTRWMSLMTGYHFADRRVSSRQDEIAATQQNRLHAGQFGIRLRGLRGFNANFDGEIGRDNNPFYPTSPRNYHALGARVEYKRKNLRLLAQARSNYNFNFVSTWSYSARSRQYGIDGSWTINDRISIDGGYSKIHLDSLTGIAYWVGLQVVDDASWFVSNTHTVHGGLRLNLWKRADLFGGWTWVRDPGGPSRPVRNPALTAAQTYPFLFNSPMVRLSVPVGRNVRWNAGYQFYGYGESLLPAQNYRAHTAYASISFSPPARR
jgi:hypothetical protein